MSANTISINQKMDLFDGHHSVWLFGYGSLIYKADFPYLQRRPASIANWTRRFWQGSHDHRGTPEAPGRVVTLIEEAGAVCHGMAYLVTPEVFVHLDHREKNGYLRLATTISFETDAGSSSAGAGAAAGAGADSCANARTDAAASADNVLGLVYIATPDNSAFLGAASEQDIARHIARSSGPSGPNSDYLNHLAQALRELGRHDQHVFDIERHLAALSAPASAPASPPASATTPAKAGAGAGDPAADPAPAADAASTGQGPHAAHVAHARQTTPKEPAGPAGAAANIACAR